MLLTNRPLKEKEIFEVKLDRLNNRWTSSLMIGALFESPEKLHLPVTALGLKKNAIVISGETLFQNGHKMPETTLGFNIDTLITNQSIGIFIDAQRNLKVLINGQDKGIVVQNVPQVCMSLFLFVYLLYLLIFLCQINCLFIFFFQLCYGLIDLYGQCEEISIVRTHNQTQNFRENDTIAELADSSTTNSILEQDEKQDSNPGQAGILSSSIIIPQIISTSNPIILRSSTTNQPLIISSVSGGVITGGSANTSAVFTSKQCDYFKLCSQFKSSLALPTHFFQQKCGTCHCHQCIKVNISRIFSFSFAIFFILCVCDFTNFFRFRFVVMNYTSKKVILPKILLCHCIGQDFR